MSLQNLLKAAHAILLSNLPLFYYSVETVTSDQNPPKNVQIYGYSAIIWYILQATDFPAGQGLA